MLTETAYAKVNLALHVRRRREDGYHELETLFAFVDAGDRLTARSAPRDELHVVGEFAEQLADPFGNIVAKALSALPRPDGLAITLDGRCIVMRASVNLDRQAGRRAVKIQHVDSGRVLAPELVSAGSFLQRVPKHGFGRRHVPALCLGSQDGLVGLLGELVADPSTTLRVVPLPIWRWGGFLRPTQGGERPKRR